MLTFHGVLQVVSCARKPTRGSTPAITWEIYAICGRGYPDVGNLIPKAGESFEVYRLEYMSKDLAAKDPCKRGDLIQLSGNVFGFGTTKEGAATQNVVIWTNVFLRIRQIRVIGTVEVKVQVTEHLRRFGTSYKKEGS